MPNETIALSGSTLAELNSKIANITSKRKVQSISHSQSGTGKDITFTAILLVEKEGSRQYLTED